MDAPFAPRLALLTVGLLVLTALGAGCTREVDLSVELITDLQSGEDFDRIYLERSQEQLEAPRCEGTDLFEPDANYRVGKQVGSAKRVHGGETWVARVTLCKGRKVILYREVKAAILADTQLRVVMADSCFERECDGEGPCSYQSCEPSIECHWGNLHACDRPACGHPGSRRCPAGQECVVSDCLEALPPNAGGDDEPDARTGTASRDGGLDAQPAEQTNPPDAAIEAAVEPGHSAADAQADAAGSLADAQPDDAPTPGADAQPDGEAPVSPVEPFSQTNKARVLYVGDALASESMGKLGWWLALKSSIEFRGAVGGRLAICDFLEASGAARPLASRLAQQMMEHKPHLLILQFWGDALTPCMADVAADPQAVLDRYKADAEQLVRQIERQAAAAAIPRPKILWVLQGPEPDPAQRERPRVLNQIYQELAARSNDRTSDAGKLVSMEVYPYDNGTKDRYQWMQFMPCLQFELDDRKRLEAMGGTADCFDGLGPVVQLHRDTADAPHSYLGKVLFCLDTTDANFECVSSVPGKVPAMPGANRYALRIAGDVNAWLGL